MKARKGGDKKAEAESPDTDNREQYDEDAQAQTVADEILASRQDMRRKTAESRKHASGSQSDDVQDLVDHMKQMETSGRIDMDAYRGEQNDDDEEGGLGRSRIENAQPRGAE